MSVGATFGGVTELLRGRPRHPVGADGRMALSDHFRELRARLIRSALVWIVLFIVALCFYNDLLKVVAHPFYVANEKLGNDVDTELVFTGVTKALMVQFKLCGVVSLIAASPYWLLQIWGFLMPALHAHERKWSRIFGAIAGPLFLIGVGVGYWVLPKGIQVLVGFTPLDAKSLIEFGDFFDFELRMLLVFGIAFEIPLFVVMLNLAGIVSGERLGKSRPWIVIGTMVFAAVATPSTDPFSMLMLAIPMLILFGVAEVIARFVDRTRGRRKHSTEQWDDDELSPL
ncbi:MAG: twin-arginine translocase subunit TatC [Nocardioides sp.]|uniref:twin-arginine translocase subunit TatC n=1 Tax=Nocardioides sp. TaxID=35761 RepID=UPI0039E564C2